MAVATKLGGQTLTIDRATDTSVAAGSPQAHYGPPSFQDGLVLRTELLAQLDRTREHPLLLVTAPAGYGKTTLLAQWSGSGVRPAAWVSIQEAKYDSAGLADSIAAALASIEIDPARPACPFTLVLDDAHRARPADVADAVHGLVNWIPHGSQVAVASRCEPALPLGRMRGHRMLVELGAEELSMSPVEAASLLRSAEIQLEFTAVQDLVRRTEGWPVALALVTNSLVTSHAPEEALAHLGGDEHPISEYFRAEFLAPLSPATVRFLMRSSVLDRLSGPLCDAVLERKRSAGVLARLARANVPIRPADPTHEWYRLHPLFREMLETELRRSEPELRRALHRRAAQWHRGVGDIDHAIDHARSGGDLNSIGQLLWAHLPRYLSGGRNGSVQQWLTGISSEQLARRPSLALVVAHSQLALGHVAVAEQVSRSAMVALSGKAGARAKAQSAGVLIIEAWAARSGLTQMAHDAARAYELLEDDSSWRASCCHLRGTAALLTGDQAEAKRQFEEGAGRGESTSADAASLCLAQLAVLALEQGEPVLADDLALRARKAIKDHGLGEYPILALVFAVSASAAVSQGRVDQAKTAAAHCIGLTSVLGDFIPWYGAETRILLARGLLALGDVAGAREQLADASRLARRTPDVMVFRHWFDEAWDQFDKHAEATLIGAGSLTTAELRVLRFLPTHFSFHEIAQRLHVSSNTVKTHVHAVYRKLDASSRSQAVANATRVGLLGC